jgi:hypothetical protein
MTVSHHLIEYRAYIITISILLQMIDFITFMFFHFFFFFSSKSIFKNSLPNHLELIVHPNLASVKVRLCLGIVWDLEVELYCSRCN